jgi:hypothetical protein
MLTMKHKAHGPRLAKFVLMPLISIVLMMLAASVNYAQSSENCSQKCIQITREDLAAAKKTADEAKASRVLIDKQSREIELLQENSALKDQVIGALTEVRDLKDKQLAEKDTQIASEKSAREATEKQLAIQTKEKEKAQRSAKFWRKVGTVAGAAAGVLIFGAVH